MYLKTLNLGDIHPYERNPRINDKAVEPVMKSIQKDGYRARIIVDKDGVIIAGHTRYEAMKRLGWTEAEVWIADDMTPEQIADYRIRDNLTADFAEWDFSELEAEIQELDLDFDMSEFEGFEDIQGGVSDTTTAAEDDFDEDVPIEPKAKLGDIYQLGQHRLICGDSTDIAVIDRLMDGGKAKLLLTDPPYGIKADKGFSGAWGFNGKGKPIERRHYKDEWDSERPEKDVFDYICLMAENAIIFGGNFFTDELPVGNHWLVWNKHNTMPTFSDAELAWTNIKRNSVKIYDVEWNGLIGKEKERFHPTQKPVKLFADILNDYTEENDVICDFFGGSGSTLIACEQLNRKCYMCELDPHYVDVIIARWEKLTDEKAVLLNG